MTKSPLSPGLKSPSAFLSSPKKTEVETTKIDPSSFLKKTPTQELMENLEPIGSAPARAPAPPVEPPVFETPAVPPPEPKPAPVILEDDILSSLIGEYGFEPMKLHRLDLTISASPKILVVDVRVPDWDDHSRSMLFMQNQLEDPAKRALVQTTTQQEQMYGIATACGCVVKINDHFVWDIFKVRDAIKLANPRWAGDTAVGVPDSIKIGLAEAVMDFFRHKIHPDFLLTLDEKIQEIQKNSVGLETANPTPAA